MSKLFFPSRTTNLIPQGSFSSRRGREFSRLSYECWGSALLSRHSCTSFSFAQQWHASSRLLWKTVMVQGMKKQPSPLTATPPTPPCFLSSACIPGPMTKRPREIIFTFRICAPGYLFSFLCESGGSWRSLLSACSRSLCHLQGYTLH